MARTSHWFTRLGAALIVMAILAACGAAPPAAPPEDDPAPTDAPAAVEEPTEAPADEEEAPAATEEPAAEDDTTDAPAASGERGSGDTLNLLWWQAPTILNPHLATGTKDFDAARIMLEPLASVPIDGFPSPNLAADIPTVENGGVADDFSSVTWTLKEDVLWSDGTPFTSEDVVFTYEYCAESATACTTATAFSNIASVEALDDYTVQITWAEPNPNPYQTFVGARGMILQKAQFENCVGEAASTTSECQEANLAPIGTGPYMLRDFAPGDVVEFDPNPNYRDPAKPFFSEVLMKGGGDATSAARAVFQTGDTDYAWNLQVEASVLLQLVEQGGQGQLLATPGASVERIMFNFTNPDPALGDERGQLSQPHPFLTDPAVREAMTLAVDRQTIAEQLYGPSGDATCYFVTTEPFRAVDELFDGSCDQNIEAANALLDEAGWELGGDGVREKDGVRLSVLFQTSVNPLRQKTQEIVKQNWEAIGVETELKSVDAGVFFDSAAGNPDNISHFFSDVQMYTTGPSEPDWTAHLCRWTSAEAAQAENEWRGTNHTRWQNEEYDALCTDLQTETDPEERIAKTLAMDNLLVDEFTQIPLVARKGVAGAANSLQGLEPTTWDTVLWNIADWTRE